MKASLVPKHVSITATPEELATLIRWGQYHIMDYHADDLDHEMLQTLKKVSEHHVEDEEEGTGGVPVK